MTNALLAMSPPDTDIMTTQANYDPLVKVLDSWILSDPARIQAFTTAIYSAASYNLSEMQNIHSINDYLAFANDLLTWIPTEAVRPKDLLVRTATMWFVLDQPAVKTYQSPIRPVLGAATDEKPADYEAEGLTWLSTWMVRFCAAFGHVQYHRVPPTARGWRTFNAFFARHVKPGRRPIASIGDPSIFTSPTDFTFMDMARITPNSAITTKGLTWPIAQMLAGSPYAQRFADGIWLHGFLDLTDYHRIHAPVAGTVLEARVIQGQSSMKFEAVPAVEDVTGTTRNELTVQNEIGYQFCQTRGLIILNTGVGLVAVLPVGMAVVSSVVLTAEVGVTLHKGEELGYFQFGGSDVVLIFESGLGTQITMEMGRHYKMGSEIGQICAYV
ncbi:hypothetical protein BDW74DRAFT_179980 [Aspergillus multicolor]|uniref:phosphatidylserine decarboxylase n=1 Tax=Aspergillus multicolor TaxID=41759 RepID=UPI003CCCC334